jgi:hypothetical protein
MVFRKRDPVYYGRSIGSPSGANVSGPSGEPSNQSNRPPYVKSRSGSYLQTGDIVETDSGELAKVKSLDDSKGALLDKAPDKYVEMYGAKPLSAPLTWYAGDRLKPIWNAKGLRDVTNERQAAIEDGERKGYEYARQEAIRRAGLTPR